MRISDWSSDVCSSDLQVGPQGEFLADDGAERVGRGELGDDAGVFQRGDDFGALYRLAHGFGQYLHGFARRVGGCQQYEGVVGLQEIGRASCRERVCQYVYISVVAVSLKKKIKLYNRYTTTY